MSLDVFGASRRAATNQLRLLHRRSELLRTHTYRSSRAVGYAASPRTSSSSIWRLTAATKRTMFTFRQSCQNHRHQELLRCYVSYSFFYCASTISTQVPATILREASYHYITPHNEYWRLQPRQRHEGDQVLGLQPRFGNKPLEFYMVCP